MFVQSTVIKYGDHIDTDVIIPARYLNTTDHAELASHCMEDLDSDFKKKSETSRIIVAGRNFGCDGQRQQAFFALFAPVVAQLNRNRVNAVRRLASIGQNAVPDQLSAPRVHLRRAQIDGFAFRAAQLHRQRAALPLFGAHLRIIKIADAVGFAPQLAAHPIKYAAQRLAALLRRLNALPQGVDFLLLPTSVRAAYGPCRLHADLHPVYPLLLIVRALAQIHGSH